MGEEKRVAAENENSKNCLRATEETDILSMYFSRYHDVYSEKLVECKGKKSLQA